MLHDNHIYVGIGIGRQTNKVFADSETNWPYKK